MSRVLPIFLFVIVLLLPGCSSNADKLHITFDVSSDDLVVFTGLGSGVSDLYLLDLNTKKVKALAATDQQEFTPAFSRDAKQIVYAASPRYGVPSHIYIRDLNSGQTRQLTNDSEANDWYPRFSPDGSRIVFTRARVFRDYSMGGKVWDDWDIYTMDTSGKNIRQVTNEHYNQAFESNFTSDGTRIIFSADDSDFHVLSVTNSTGMQKPRKLLSGSGSGCSKTNGSMVFVADRAVPYDYEIWKATDDGSSPVQLSQLHSYIEHPVFSHDGRHIYFLSDKGRNGKCELWRIDSDGKGASRIAEYNLFADPLMLKP